MLHYYVVRTPQKQYSGGNQQSQRVNGRGVFASRASLEDTVVAMHTIQLVTETQKKLPWNRLTAEKARVKSKAGVERKGKPNTYSPAKQ